MAFINVLHNAWRCWRCTCTLQSYCKMIFFVKLIFPYIRLLFLGWDCVEPFEAALKLQFGPSTGWLPLNSTIWRKIVFSSKTFISFRTKKERHEHLGWHGNKWIIRTFSFCKWTSTFQISLLFLDNGSGPSFNIAIFYLIYHLTFIPHALTHFLILFHIISRSSTSILH